jgi:Uma2 family endonuclease
MSQLARGVFSFADYVGVEDDSSIKHEYLDGVVYAMASGSPEHAAVAANVIALLRVAVAGKRCRVFSSDLRVRVKPTGLATYPDASVICERVELDPEDAKGHTALNPTLLVEVLSPSTEDYDRGEKLAHYKRIGSLREVMLVAHDERCVEVWRRVEGRWRHRSFAAGEHVELESLGVTLPVDEDLPRSTGVGVAAAEPASGDGGGAARR